MHLVIPASWAYADKFKDSVSSHLFYNLLIHYQKPRFTELAPVDFSNTKPFLEQLIVHNLGQAVGTGTLIEHTWSYGDKSNSG
jgi:hypothetical protein